MNTIYFIEPFLQKKGFFYRCIYKYLYCHIHKFKKSLRFKKEEEKNLVGKFRCPVPPSPFPLPPPLSIAVKHY